MPVSARARRRRRRQRWLAASFASLLAIAPFIRSSWTIDPAVAAIPVDSLAAQDGGLVAAPRAHIQDAVVLRNAEQLAHEGDDVRLRNALVTSDRKRAVLVRVIAECRRNEEVTGNARDRPGHTHVDPVADERIGEPPRFAAPIFWYTAHGSVSGRIRLSSARSTR